MKIIYNKDISAMWATRYKLETSPFSGNDEKCVEADVKHVQCFNFGSGKTWLVSAGASRPIEDAKIKETYLSFSFDNYPKIQDCDSRCKLLDSSNLHSLEQLKSNCSKEELEMGRIEEEDPIISGLFIDGNLAAASSVIEYDPLVSDIGVLVSRDYRRQGLAYEVVKFLSHHINLSGRAGHYGCDQKNIGSHKTALKLGLTLAMVVETY